MEETQRDGRRIPRQIQASDRQTFWQWLWGRELRQVDRIAARRMDDRPVINMSGDVSE